MQFSACIKTGPLQYADAWIVLPAMHICNVFRVYEPSVHHIGHSQLAEWQHLGPRFLMSWQHDKFVTEGD